jgi:putative lipoprotein
MKLRFAGTYFAAVAVFLSGCATVSPSAKPAASVSSSVITGTASYPEKITLPPSCTFVAQLNDVTRADGPAITLAEQKFENPGAPPFEFRIPYNPAEIQPNGIYNVSGRILCDGQLRMTSPAANRVLGAGGTTSANLVLELVDDRVR